MRDNFFNELANKALDAGRRPGPDGMLEFEEAKLHQADLESVVPGGDPHRGYGDLRLEPNQRLALDPEDLNAYIRTYETDTVSSGRP